MLGGFASSQTVELVLESLKYDAQVKALLVAFPGLKAWVSRPIILTLLWLASVKYFGKYWKR
jgi:hypothetical protein